MKKLILVASLLVACAVPSFAATATTRKFKVHTDINGVSAMTPKWSGVNNLVLVTSTSAALATDIDGNTITDGFIDYVVIPSSFTGQSATTGTSFLVMRDTATANLTSTILTPYIVSYSASGLSTAPVSQMLTFDPPIPFKNGLSVNLGPALTAPLTGQGFGVGVRWKARQ